MKKTMYCLALIVTVASLFLFNVSLFASETDDRIESSAKQTYVFKTYLKGDDIKIQSKDDAVTLTGIVLEESHKSLAKETVAGLLNAAFPNHYRKIDDGIRSFDFEAALAALRAATGPSA